MDGLQELILIDKLKQVCFCQRFSTCQAQVCTEHKDGIVTKKVQALKTCQKYHLFLKNFYKINFNFSYENSRPLRPGYMR
jgi:hypothetical protein